MEKIDLRGFGDEGFIVHLEGPPSLIAVDTLSETLLGLTEALKAINGLVNPDFALEVYVDSVRPGSIRIGVRLKKSFIAAGLVGSMAVAPLAKDAVVALLSNYLYDKLMVEEPCSVNISSDRVTIQGDNCNVTMSKDAFDKRSAVDASPKVARGVKRAMDAAKKDTAVHSLSVIGRGSRPPVVKITRERFDAIVRQLDNEFTFTVLEEVRPKRALLNDKQNHLRASTPHNHQSRAQARKEEMAIQLERHPDIRAHYRPRVFRLA